MIRVAAEGQHYRVQNLLSEGASVNHRDRENCTALYRAVLSGRFKVVELLINSGADVNARPDGWEYPLEIAKDKGYTAIAALLQECGAVSSSLGKFFGSIIPKSKPKPVPQHTPKANAVNPQSIAEIDAFGPLSSRARFPRCQPCLYKAPTSRYPDSLWKGDRCVDCGIAFEEDPHSRKFAKLF